MVESRSAPLAEYIARRRGRQFVPVLTADPFRPECNGNLLLHQMSFGASKMILLDGDVNDFRLHLRESRFYAMFLKGRATAAADNMDFLTFRFRRATFHFSSSLSYAVRENLATVLHQESGGKTAFTLKNPPLLEFLSGAFNNWVPPNVVDVTSLVTDGRVAPELNAMSTALTNGPYCRRACVFVDFYGTLKEWG